MRNLILFIALLLFLNPLQAQAYLDPGSGSIIVQAVIAVFAGAAFALKMYWQKTQFFFHKDKKVDNNKNDKHQTDGTIE